jgi:hypothetical protein
VQEFGRRESYSPGYREIAEELGLAVSAVSHHVGVAARDVFLGGWARAAAGLP